MTKVPESKLTLELFQYTLLWDGYVTTLLLGGYVTFFQPLQLTNSLIIHQKTVRISSGSIISVVGRTTIGIMEPILL